MSPDRLLRALAWTCAIVVLGLLPLHARADESPAAPYWSLHVASTGSRAQAQAILKQVASEPAARIEKRRSYVVRFGAWVSKRDAEKALETYRDKFDDARVLQIENPVAWLLPGGATLAAPGTAAAVATAAPAAAPAPAAPAPAPIAPASNGEFRAGAQRLDAEMRRWVGNGVARDDGYTYAMDVAPLLLFAAQRRDTALYEQLLEAARPLIVAGEDAMTSGFVLWRTRPGADPEVSGAAEALWMARALWAGHRLLKRADDRAVALHVVDGYARHALGAQGSWRVAKYYAFGTKSFAPLSVLPGYDPDFIDEVEALAGAEAKGLARRSYALLQRARTPSRLLVPLVQPAITDLMPAFGASLYAPNGVVSLEDSCAAAEGALRGIPELARDTLAFAAAPARRDANGRLYAYYHRKDGHVIGEQVLSATGYACLGRIAAATRDRPSQAALKAVLLGDMRLLTDAPDQQAAPLYAAGPLLLAADALGAL